MVIYSKEVLKDTDVVGSRLLVGYLEEDAAAVNEYLTRFQEEGVYFHAVAKSLESCEKDGYFTTIEREMNESRIAVFFLSQAFFAEKNKGLRNVVWYEIGFLLGEGKKIVLFFLDIPKEQRNDLLYRTPVRQIQGCDNFEDMMHFIDKNNVMHNLFYADSTVNRYAYRRIFYVRLTTVFHIYRDTLLQMKNDLNRFDEDEFDDRGVVDAFLKELVCGCTVTGFNRKEELSEAFRPYVQETEILPKDYPANYRFQRPVVLDFSEGQDIYVTVKSELILPVHALLGVNFKPFLGIRRFSRFRTEHLVQILKDNYHSADLKDRDVAVIKDQNEQRVYFLMDLSEIAVQAQPYGEKVNFLFPQ